MASPFETFAQRFGGRPLGAYNPFGAANQYASPYTPGAFQPIPTTGTPQAQTPGQGAAPGQGGGEGGRDNGQGIAPGTGGQGSPGYAPGYSDEAAIAGSLLGLVIPGAGLLSSVGNGAAGIQAANQQADMMSKITGRPVELGAADYASAATGGLLGGGDYEKGLGGYGQIGQGGITGMQNMMDPGVAGAARAQAASIVNQNNPAGPIGPAPGGLLSAPAPAKPAGGLLTTPSTPGMAVPTPAKPVAKPAAKPAAPSTASIEAAKVALAKSLGSNITSSTQISPGSKLGKMMADIESSMKSGANAKTASDLARSGLGMQQGKSGVSGSQIKGGRTVGNNPNDRSGRNPGAPRDAGAGGRLGGGV